MKTKYGSMPNKNRVHLMPSSLIYDEDNLAELISEALEAPTPIAAQLISPPYHHHSHQHQQQQQVEYYFPNCYYQSVYPNHFNYYY